MKPIVKPIPKKPSEPKKKKEKKSLLQRKRKVGSPILWM